MARALIPFGNEWRVITFHEKSTMMTAYCVSRAKMKNSPRPDWELLWTIPAGNQGEKWDYWKVVNLTASRLSGGVAFVDHKYYVPADQVFQAVTKLTDEYSRRYKPFTKRLPLKDVLEIARNEPVQPPDPDRVLWYKDDCPMCNKRHRVSHYPSGRIICEDMNSLRNNPGLYYMYHKNGIFYFGFNGDKL